MKLGKKIDRIQARVMVVIAYRVVIKIPYFIFLTGEIVKMLADSPRHEPSVRLVNKDRLWSRKKVDLQAGVDLDDIYGILLSAMLSGIQGRGWGTAEPWDFF